MAGVQNAQRNCLAANDRALKDPNLRVGDRTRSALDILLDYTKYSKLYHALEILGKYIFIYYILCLTLYFVLYQCTVKKIFLVRNVKLSSRKSKNLRFSLLPLLTEVFELNFCWFLAINAITV